MLTDEEIKHLPFANSIQVGVNPELRRLILCFRIGDDWVAGAISESDVKTMAAYFENMLNGGYTKQ